jgi:peptide/nickel transport system substrate-binding protein
MENLGAGTDGPDGQARGSLTRQDFLQRAGLGAGAVFGLSPFLAACGSDGGSSQAAPASTPAAAKAGGTFRVGVAGGGASDSVDAHRFISIVDWSRFAQLYDSLVAYTPEGGVVPALAESFEPGKNAREWTIRLREGVEFHNGKTLTADDVIFTFRRMLDPNFANTSGSNVSFIDPKGLKKLDELTIRLQLAEPVGDLLTRFAPLHSLIVPEGFDPKKPIGTGPFKLVDFKAGDRSTHARHDNYWRGTPKFDEVVILDFPDDAARMNALIADQVDAINGVPYSQAQTIEQNGDLTLQVSETGSWTPITMRMDIKPFDDVRVRTAMKLIIDRQQTIDQALNGYGRPANDMDSPFDPSFPTDVPQREQDIEQAKSLLKQAGQEGMRVELSCSALAAGIVEACQAFAEQAKAAGVTVQVKRIDPGAYYSEGYPDYTMGVDVYSTHNFLENVYLHSMPNAPYGLTHNNDKEFHALVKRGAAELDEAKRNELLGQAQVIQHERGGNMVWSFVQHVDAYKKNVAGLPENPNGYGLNMFDFHDVGFV